MAYYHLSNPQAHIFDRQKGKKKINLAVDAHGKTIFWEKKMNKLWHIKSAGNLTILIRIGKLDVTETENNLEHHPKKEEGVFNKGLIKQVAQGVPLR